MQVEATARFGLTPDESPHCELARPHFRSTVYSRNLQVLLGDAASASFILRIFLCVTEMPSGSVSDHRLVKC